MRVILKVIFTILVFPAVVWVKLAGFRGGEPHSFATFGKYYALFPGRIGDWLRKAYYHWTLTSFDWTAGIEFGSYFSHQDAGMGPDSSAGAYCILGQCEIGQGVRMGSQISVLSGKEQHYFDDSGQIQDGALTSVHIGDNTWIGNGALILANVGSGCIIGAGSVVVKPIGDNAIAGGNPAKLLKQRDLVPAAESS